MSTSETTDDSKMSEDWFPRLCEENRTLVEGLKKKGWDKGLRRLAVDKYPDPVHFVYELLQNAEDQDATRVEFRLRPNHLLFRHNGKPFSARDVEGITGLGDSDKPLSDEVKIGRFGIGFKSVFVVTERPEIYSTLNGKPFSFAIEDIFVPTHQPDSLGYCRENETCFVLPFKEADRKAIHEKIRAKLHSLGADILLFLDDITDIDWETDEESGTYVCERETADGNDIDGIRCILLGESGPRGEAKMREEAEYLVFLRPVRLQGTEENRALSVQIAFRIHDGRVIPEVGQNFVNVYFPTEEKSDLKFRLHAPFLLTDNRANIKRGEDTNEHLIETAAGLLVASLRHLKERGLLDTACLEVLPLRRPQSAYYWHASSIDEEGIFEPFFTKTREALMSDPLLPTDGGGHVCAKDAMLARSSGVRGLLSEAQLTALFGNGTPQICRQWLSSDITDDRTPELRRFLLGIGVTEVDPEGFATKITAGFLGQQDDEWIIRFYTFLSSLEMLWGKGRNPILRSRPILRLENGEHVVPFKADGETPTAYLPPSGWQTSLPLVKKSIAAVPECLDFLTRLGLTAPDAVGDVIEFILPIFDTFAREPGGASAIKADEYASALVEMAAAIAQCPQAKLTAFLKRLADTHFVIAENAIDATFTMLLPPSAVYENTENLRIWYDRNPAAWFVAPMTANDPNWPAIASALASIGTTPKNDVVPLYKRPPYGDVVSLWSVYGDHARGLDSFDPEANIHGLDFVIANITVERACLLWRILLTIPKLVRGYVERATRQDYSNGRIEGPKFSSLGSLVSDHAWLPDAHGTFHQPEKIALTDLPDTGFDRDSALAKALARQLSMKQTEAFEVAERLGISADDLSDFLSMSQQERTEWRQFRDARRLEEARISAMPSKPSFPSSVSRNPERRAQKMRDYAAGAGEKTHGKVERSIRLSAGLVAEDVDAYLRHLYENEDGVMVCQLCQNAMPFRRDDGAWYFERVQCVRDVVGKELYPNYLALCPVCAAKYKVVNHTEPAEIINLLLSHRGQLEDADASMPVEINIVLGGERHNLCFVLDHLHDLQAILSDESVFVGQTMTVEVGDGQPSFVSTD